MQQPEIGGTFYGLVSYTNIATLSDIIKGKDLVLDNEAQVDYDYKNSTAIVLGEVRKNHSGYYHSHPIISQYVHNDKNKLVEICSNQKLSSLQRYELTINELRRPANELKAA